MRTNIFICGIFLVFINTCNQHTSNKIREAASVGKKVESNNSDTNKNIIENKEVVVDSNSEQTKIENKKVGEAHANNEYFTLLSAISQSWTAGIPSGGSGTDYYFKLKIHTAEDLKFDSAWINNKKFEIFLEKETTSISNAPIKFTKGDTITLRISDINNPNSKTENLKPPINFDGAALIGYSVNEKRQYFIIKEIIKQVSLDRP